MPPGDVDEAKRYDLVSELLTSSIEAAQDVDAVASCRCLGCLSAAPSAYALAVSARLLVEQAEAARYDGGHLASGITHWQLSLGLDGYLVMSDYPSRVGLLGAPFFSGDVSWEFYSKSVRAMWVECPCGWKMKIYNFSLDVVLCAFCRDVVSEPHGKNIKLLNGVSELPRSVLRRRIDNASVLSYESARSGH